MPRKARVVAVGCPHHITQRGNSRRQVFFTDQDREIYLRLLAEYAERYGLHLSAYCLMTNHIHLIATPEDEESLATALNRTHSDYARYANVQQGGCGHFWQARFFSCPLDDRGCWKAMAYVERNPVRAGMVGEAVDYVWSSARAHALGRHSAGILALDAWRAEYDADGWSRVLAVGIDEEAFQARIRRATQTGLPLGDEEFVKHWEDVLGRNLEIRGRGRPRSAEKRGRSHNSPF